MMATFEDDKDNASAAPQSKPAAGGTESTAQAGNQQESDPQEAEQDAPDKQETSGEPAAQTGGEQTPAEEQSPAEQQYYEQLALQEQRAAEQAAAEQAAAEQAAPRGTGLGLTVPKIGLYGASVTNSISESVLANGADKIPSTGFPWQPGANTYIAGHVYGYPGTGSWQLFAGLPSLVPGDQIFLTDSSGTAYEYRVTEVLVVAPTDVWVAQPTGQNMVSLQTCVVPGWSERLVVRAMMIKGHTAYSRGLLASLHAQAPAEAYARSVGASRYIMETIPHYYELAPKVGIAPDVLVTQAILETGNGYYGGDSGPWNMTG